MDFDDPPPRYTNPRYDSANVIYVEPPVPPLPKPDSSGEVHDFLQKFFAHYYSIPPDHLFVQELVARFEGDGRALYSTPGSELRPKFGFELGQRLHETLGSSSYGWVSLLYNPAKKNLRDDLLTNKRQQPSF